MSRELREKADKISQELREALVPLRDEIKRLQKTGSFMDYSRKEINPAHSLTGN